MATSIRLEFSGMSLDDYDRVCEALNFPADWPEGLLVHGSADTGDGGSRVVDVWESADKFDAFVEARLGPAIGQALGDRAQQPERTDTELHTFYKQ